MMEFTQNDWGKRDSIDKVIILTKLDTDTIHVINPTKYQNYPLTTMLGHGNVLNQLKKSHYVCLINIKPYDAYSITIHVCTMNISDIIHKKSIEILLSNEQDMKTPSSKIQVFQTLCAI